jgi:hypothetical protein
MPEKLVQVALSLPHFLPDQYLGEGCIEKYSAAAEQSQLRGAVVVVCFLFSRP